MAATKPPTGPIQSGTLYPLECFKQLAGMSTSAMRAARMNGLRVRYVGKRAFINGEDFLTYINMNARSERRQLRKSGGGKNG